jgi:hypothetical protein
MVLVAATLALSGVAAAGPGPLTPLKYHKAAGVIQEPDVTQLFVMFYDNLDPTGHVAHLNGSIGAIGSTVPYVAEATFFEYDLAAAHSLFTFTGVVDTTGTGLPISGQLNVTYDRLQHVHSIAVDGVINGTPFSVPPMVITI